MLKHTTGTIADPVSIPYIFKVYRMTGPIVVVLIWLAHLARYGRWWWKCTRLSLMPGTKPGSTSRNLSFDIDASRLWWKCQGSWPGWANHPCHATGRYCLQVIVLRDSEKKHPFGRLYCVLSARIKCVSPFIVDVIQKNRWSDMKSSCHCGRM